MKKLIITAVISVGVLSFNASAAIDSQKSYKFIGDTEYAGICEAAVTDNVSLFKKSVNKQLSWLNSSRAQSHEVLLNQDNFQCDGMGVLEFAETRGSQNLIDYLSPKNIDAVSTTKFSFIGDTQFAGFCKAAVTNNVKLFKRAVRTQIGSLAPSRKEVLELVLDANNVQCAGMGISEFSEKRNATEIVEFIANKRA
ncbi:MAG: hypothetical protein ACI88A_001946 [Paraglaciecola sp.]|jgi:hypothetical protein